jgi:hypothetical protein
VSGQVEAIASGSLLLHIGPYKTGTTAIQRSLHKHRADLARHGVLYPGSTPRQRRASWAAVGRSPRGAEPVAMQAWRRMLREVAETDAERVVVSSEDFTSAPPDAVRAIVDDLGRDRVHVVMVIRPLDRLLPSSWQQRVKSARETLTLDGWLHEVLERPGGWKGPTFWKNQGVDSLVERYAVQVPRERIIIVVSDESDRTQQMRTFEGLLGLPTGLLTPGDHQNTSLSLDRTEFLRRVNVLAAEREWSEQTRRALIHGGMLAGLRHLPAQPGERLIPGLPDWAVERVAALNRERAERVVASGCRVVGDPSTLAAPPRPGDSEPLPEHLSLVLAAAGVAGVVDAVRRHEEQAARGSAGAPRASGAVPAAAGAAGPGGSDVPGGLGRARTADLAGELARRVRGRLRRPLRRP